MRETWSWWVAEGGCGAKHPHCYTLANDKVPVRGSADQKLEVTAKFRRRRGVPLDLASTEYLSITELSHIALELRALKPL